MDAAAAAIPARVRYRITFITDEIVRPAPGALAALYGFSRETFVRIRTCASFFLSSSHSPFLFFLFFKPPRRVGYTAPTARLQLVFYLLLFRRIPGKYGVSALLARNQRGTTSVLMNSNRPTVVEPFRNGCSRYAPAILARARVLTISLIIRDVIASREDDPFRRRTRHHDSVVPRDEWIRAIVAI